MDEKDYDKNVDYRKMYYRLSAAVEDAIQALIAVQQECEEMYIDADEGEKEE